jgi:dTDP-glucose 4,6-dehydratase
MSAVLADPRVSFVHGSITDGAITDATLAGAWAVLHLAAESHVDRSIASAQPFFETNVLGTRTTARECPPRWRRALHTRLHRRGLRFDLTSERGTKSILDPRSPYSASKAGSDLAALAYASTFGLHVSVTRCSNNYGPRQFPEKVIPLFVTNLADGLSVPLYGDGLNIRDWLHVDDHCRGIIAVLERGRSREVYNIGGGTQLTNLELTHRLLELCGAGTDRIEAVQDRLGHDRRYCVDDSKIRNELGYEPRVNFDEGLAATVRWYHDNEPWWRPLKVAP